MPQRLTLSVSEGTTHVIPFGHLTRLQVMAANQGEARFPLIIRLGAVRDITFQPVTVLAIHTELRNLVPRIQGSPIPGVRFQAADGAELGGYDGGDGEMVIARTDDAQLSITSAGIRIVVHQFPPPVGFRSGPGLEPGWYECHFDSLQFGADEVTGSRTQAMGGSGAPIRLSRLPGLPPATRWHHARVAGAPTVAVVQFTSTPAEEVFRDLLHALDAACVESLRLKRPLRVRAE